MFALFKTPPLAGCSSKVSQFATAFAVAVSLFASSASAQSSSPWPVIASGLNNPRGLDFAPNGALYIAEAGTGGPAGSPELPGPEGVVRFGLSGSLTRVFKGTQTRIITGLPSLAGPTGGGAIGPSAVSFGQNGNAALTIGLGRNPALRANLGSAGTHLGTLWQLNQNTSGNQNGQLKLLADLAGFELNTDPDKQGADSNPNGVLNDRGGAVYVADAGGNTLLAISANGAISVVAVFPNRDIGTGRPMQAVPTNVVRGPDGALYVSQLTGVPFPKGAANVYRVVPGSAPTVYASGFTNIIDLEFDAAGNLYVLEIDANGLADISSVEGRLAQVRASDHTTIDVAKAGLVMPGGMAIGPDGFIYVSNYSTAPGIGEVVRIPPPQP